VSVRKRKLANGACWQVDYRDGSGARRHRQFVTKREAEAFHVRARSRVHIPDNASITVAEAATFWLSRCERDHLEPTTIAAYRQHLDLHIRPHIGSIKLARLTVPTVNTFRDQLLDGGRSRDMVKRVLSSLAAIVSEAQARGLVAVNNVRAIARIKRERRSERLEMPSHGELQAIIAATP
jgi:integrase